MAAMAWWAVTGAGLGSALVWWARPREWKRARRPLAMGLVVAALVYVAFAVLAGEAADILRAIIGVAIFAGFAALGARFDPWWLAAGWALHVLWDGALHWTVPQVAPGWYAFLCFGFDLVVAGAILVAPQPGVPPGREPRAGVPSP